MTRDVPDIRSDLVSGLKCYLVVTGNCFLISTIRHTVEVDKILKSETLLQRKYIVLFYILLLMMVNYPFICSLITIHYSVANRIIVALCDD